VYGCSSDQNGNSECYLAHAAASSIDQPAAYEYAQGAGFYTSDVTQALPVLDGPSSLNVRAHGSGRWFATYVLPLDSKVTVQSAVGPAGPFSQAQTLLNCQLGPNDFCSGGNQHPELDPDASAIAVSYVAASFNTEAPGSRYWPRLAFPTLPEELP